LSQRDRAEPQALLDYESAAQWLGCTPRLVRKLAEHRQIATVKIGRLVRIEPSALVEYVERRRREAVR
ncbi:MAG: helix-turn-helix domain-containing protein, partial [Nitrososphaerales archaeon]